jgi:hypothetical protein
MRRFNIFLLLRFTARPSGPVRTVTTSTARYAPYNRPMPAPSSNSRSENVASISGVCHNNVQPPRNHHPTSSAVQPYASKPPSLDMVPQQVCTPNITSSHSMRYSCAISHKLP